MNFAVFMRKICIFSLLICFEQVRRMIKSLFATFQHGPCIDRDAVHLHSRILILICARTSCMHSPD